MEGLGVLDCEHSDQGQVVERSPSFLKLEIAQFGPIWPSYHSLVGAWFPGGVLSVHLDH